MAKRGRKPKGPKRRAVKISLAPRENAGKVTQPYRIMEALIHQERADLRKLRIGIAWHSGWRADADGVRTLGKCIKRTDLDRAMDGFDFMIVLNQEAWSAFTDRQKERLIFHELCHAQVCLDKSGFPMFDDKGRLVTRTRRHNVTAFREEITEYGWQEDLSEIANAGIADADRGLLKIAEAKAQERSASDKGPATSDEHLRFVPTGMKKAHVDFHLDRDDEGWSVHWDVQIGRYELHGDMDEAGTAPDRDGALLAAGKAIDAMLAKMQIMGTAPQKVEMEQRVHRFREQLVEWLRATVGDRPAGGTVETEESR